MNADDEQSLVARARSGEIAAVELLYRWHAGRIQTLCTRIAGAYFGYGLATRQLAFASSHLDAPTRQMLKHNLTVVDEAARQVHAALANDPHNPMYLDALLLTRASEIDMLEDVAGYPTHSL